VDNATQWRAFWFKAVKNAAATIAVGLFFFSDVILLSQTLGWLKTDVWKPFTIADVLHDWGLIFPYAPGMLGVQKFLNVLLPQPAALVYLLTSGFMIVFILGLNKIAYD
jgi:hypothetical protein